MHIWIFPGTRQWGRDLRRSAYTIRTQENMSAEKGRGLGREQSPADLDTIADLQKLPGLLTARGYTVDDIAAIMHGNWLRLLRQVWAT